MKMKQKSQTRQTGATKAIKDIRRATRKQYSAEEKIRIVLDGLRGEETIAELCRREGIAQSIYYKWSKEFLEAGKRRLAGAVRGIDPETGFNYDDTKRYIDGTPNLDAAAKAAVFSENVKHVFPRLANYLK
jgi:transposase-like protein